MSPICYARSISAQLFVLTLTWIIGVWLPIFLFCNSHLKVLLILHEPNRALIILQLRVEEINRLEKHCLDSRMAHDLAL